MTEQKSKILLYLPLLRLWYYYLQVIVCTKVFSTSSPVLTLLKLSTNETPHSVPTPETPPTLTTHSRSCETKLFPKLGIAHLNLFLPSSTMHQDLMRVQKWIKLVYQMLVSLFELVLEMLSLVTLRVQ